MSPPMDWTPVRYEHNELEYYCSPACGKNCLYSEYTECTKQATKLAKRLGPGWRPVVTENLGWHWCVRKGTADMHSYDSGRVFWLSVIVAGRQFQCNARTPFEAIGIVWVNIRVAAQELEAAALSLRSLKQRPTTRKRRR